MQLGEGRTPQPVENVFFNAMVEWMRLFLVTVSMVGLFCGLLLTIEGNNRQEKPTENKRSSMCSAIRDLANNLGR